MSSKMEFEKSRRPYTTSAIHAFMAVFVLSFMFLQWAVAQETVVNGRVTDAETGDPLPFVNVLFQGTYTGTTSDFEGYFSLRTHEAVDSLEVSYIGYHKRVKPVARGQNQTINFQLLTDRKSTRLNSSHVKSSYAVFCLKNKINKLKI